jgi:hypothetical protein
MPNYLLLVGLEISAYNMLEFSGLLSPDALSRSAKKHEVQMHHTTSLTECTVIGILLARGRGVPASASSGTRLISYTDRFIYVLQLRYNNSLG